MGINKKIAFIVILTVAFFMGASSMVLAKPKKNKKSAPTKTESAGAENPYENGEKDGSASGEEKTEPEASSVQNGNTASPSESGSLRRSGRMEFDERLIKGQAAKSGAVYLFKKIPRRLPGLVAMRRSYRNRIVEPILGKIELKPVQVSAQTKNNLKKKKIGKKILTTSADAKATDKNLETDQSNLKPEKKQAKKKKRKRKQRKKRKRGFSAKNGGAK